MNRFLPRLVLLLLLVASPSLFAATATFTNADDCHSEFSGYVAARPYIINPAVADRAQTTIVAVFEDSGAAVAGIVPFRVEVRSVATGQIVFSKSATGELPANGFVEAVSHWNAVDSDGQPVPDGEYSIEVAGTLQRARAVRGDESDDAAPSARSTRVNVVVDRAGRYDTLFTAPRHVIAPQASSIDTTFPYQFFFGTTHAHTSWSDGGMPTTDCASGRYGYAGGATPTDAFNYAKTSGSVDFIAVVEHNHLMQDACTSCTAQQILDRYHSGITAAQNATVAGSFVGLFGMEWGVISGGGHVNIYNQTKLMSWTGEPYDVLVDKSVYSQLYTAIKNNQGTYGSYGSFCHPNSTDFNSFARTTDGDAVMRAIAMISGPAFNTSTSFSPGGSVYESMFQLALERGWKVAPESHQDNHCWNYGNSTPNRTGVVIPTGSTFNQQTLMSAYNGRHIFASQDRNAQLIFRTSDNAHILGDVFSTNSLSVNVSLRDPDGDSVQKIEVWGGPVGTVAAPGAAPTVVASNTSSTSLSAALTAQTSGTEWYYYAKVVEADGDILWSAPMWVTWSSGCSAPGTSSLSSPANGATGVATAPTLSWTAASGATSYDVYFGTGSSPALYQNTTSTSLAVSGLANSTTYYWRVVPKNSCGSAASTATQSFTTAASSCTLPSAATLSSPANSATGVATATTLSWTAASGATSYDVYFSNSSSPAFKQNTTTTSLSVSALSAGTTYYWRVVAKNSCGSAASSATFSFTTANGVVTLLNEGAESGAPGWTFVKNTGSGWSIQSSTSSHSGSYRFRTNAAYVDYINSADWSLVSPAFSLVGKTTATLTYYCSFSTESGYDYFSVEVSKDGGTTWTSVRKSSGQSSGYPGWAPQGSINLSPYVGSSNTKIRFRLTSDGSVTDAGAAVDDIVVTAQ